MPPLHLLRMARWARRPASERRVMLVLGVIAACLVLFALERWVGWPAALSPEQVPAGRIGR